MTHHISSAHRDQARIASGTLENTDSREKRKEGSEGVPRIISSTPWPRVTIRRPSSPMIAVRPYCHLFRRSQVSLSCFLPSTRQPTKEVARVDCAKPFAINCPAQVPSMPLRDIQLQRWPFIPCFLSFQPNSYSMGLLDSEWGSE